MKKVILLLTCLLFFTADIRASALTLEGQEIDQIIYLETSNLEYNLGDIPKDKIIKRRVEIINKLKEAIKINDIKSTCECIEAKTQPQTVEKDGIFEVEVVLDSTGLSGEVEKVLYILTENLKYELIRLVVTATIVK